MKTWQNYSTSQRVILAYFVGGPYDGDRTMLDSENISGYAFSNASAQVTFAYEGPIRNGSRWEMRYQGPQFWGAGDNHILRSNN